MSNYYVEFNGELKDDQQVINRFVNHYNNWCTIINDRIQGLNDEFDEKWNGEPIKDYSENEEYNNWMLENYKKILIESKMDSDLFMNYDIDDNNCQLYGIGKYGKNKGKRIGFVIKLG